MATFLFLGLTFSLPAAEPVKVGVLGPDKYQAVAFTQLFHDPKAEGDLAGIRVVAAFPAGSPDIEESVRELPKWQKDIQTYGVKIVDSVDALLSQVDAVIIMSVDGRAHREQAKAVIMAGKPLYIGRPMVAQLEDAIAIFALAKEKNVPVFSCSQHRYSHGFIGMKSHEEVGDVIGCDVYGGCRCEFRHDLVWHGIHGIETLYTIMGPGCVSVTRASTDTADVVTGIWKDGHIGTYRAILKGPPKYSATVFGAKGVSTAGIYGHGVPVKGIVPTNDRYMGYEAAAMQIGKFFKTKVPPMTPEETTGVFAFIPAADESKTQGGAPVKIEAVMDKAMGK